MRPILWSQSHVFLFSLCMCNVLKVVQGKRKSQNVGFRSIFVWFRFPVIFENKMFFFFTKKPNQHNLTRTAYRRWPCSENALDYLELALPKKRTDPWWPISFSLLYERMPVLLFYWRFGYIWEKASISALFFVLFFKTSKSLSPYVVSCKASSVFPCLGRRGQGQHLSWSRHFCVFPSALRT